MPPYKDKTGRWRFRGIFDGRPYSGSSPKGSNTKKTAIDIEASMIEKLRRRVFTGTMPTVREFSDKFLEYQRVHTRPLTYQLQCTHIQKHVLPFIGTKRLDAITQHDLDMLKIEWAKNSAPTTINTRLGTVLRLFALAVEWKYLVSAPDAKALKIDKNKKRRFFTEAEARALLNAAHPRWRTMMTVGLHTGLRIGELRGLQWGDIDFANARLNVNRSDAGIAGMEPGPPKGGRARPVSLNADARQALVDRLEERRRKRGRISPDEWVWPGVETWKDQRNRGRSRSEGGCVNAIASALKGAGIKDGPGDRLGWHTLRHTFASWMAIRGVPLIEIQVLLGHASIRQTEVYAHLSPNATHHAAVATLEATYVDTRSQRALNAPSDLDAIDEDDD